MAAPMTSMIQPVASYTPPPTYQAAPPVTYTQTVPRYVDRIEIQERIQQQPYERIVEEVVQVPKIQVQTQEEVVQRQVVQQQVVPRYVDRIEIQERIQQQPVERIVEEIVQVPRVQ